MLQIRDVVNDLRYLYRPVVHLRTGGVMAMEVLARSAPGELGELRPVTGLAERLAKLDVAIAAEAARRAGEHVRLLPLHVGLWADTVCAERNPLPSLLAALAECGRDPGGVVIRLGAPQADIPARRLTAGLQRLRRAGFGLGMDTGSYPLATLSTARPEVLLLTADQTAGLPDAPDAVAALAASATLATRTGALLIADGIDRREQIAAVRSCGVHLMQGDMLGPPQRRPRTQAIPAAVLDHLGGTEPAPRKAQRPQPVAPVETDPLPRTVADLAHPAAILPEHATGEAARTVFADRPELTGLVLVDADGRPRHSLDRNRFMLAVTGPFGHSLYARRGAAQLAEPPRTAAALTSLTEAMQLVTSSPPDRMYDDIVLVDADGRCRGVLRVSDMIRNLVQRDHGAEPHHLRPSANVSFPT